VGEAEGDVHFDVNRVGSTPKTAALRKLASTPLVVQEAMHRLRLREFLTIQFEG
jgi:hypothetical protein